MRRVDSQVENASEKQSAFAGLLRHGAFATFAVLIVLLAGSAPAFAQDGGGGGGDAIQQTLTNVRNYLAALSFSVGGIGFVASLLVKGYASINENAHAYAAMGMKGSLWCIIAGVIVTPILSIAITLDIYSHVIPGMGDQTARAMEDALS